MGSQMFATPFPAEACPEMNSNVTVSQLKTTQPIRLLTTAARGLRQQANLSVPPRSGGTQEAFQGFALALKRIGEKGMGIDEAGSEQLMSCIPWADPS